MIPIHWTPYRRESDHELIGYLAAEDGGSTPFTVFGYPLSAASARAEAVRVLESRGLPCLAEPWWLRTADGREVKVLLLTAYPDQIVAVRADYGIYHDTSERFDLPVPATGLRPG